MTTALELLARTWRRTAAALALARRTVVDEATQEIEAARLSLATLERRLAEQQESVQIFNERFKEFKALEEGLARLDVLYAENEERLAQIQVRNLKKFPPIQDHVQKGQAILVQAVDQGARNVLLADQLFEGPGTPLSRQYLVGHIRCSAFSFRRGDRRERFRVRGRRGKL